MNVTDEENVGLALDLDMEKMMDNFSPEYNIIDLDYNKVNKNLYLPPTTVATVASYMVKEEEQDDECPIYKKLLES